LIKGPKDDETVKEIYQSLLYFETTVIGKLDERKATLTLSNIYYF
jgi:hypothetical protein